MLGSMLNSHPQIYFGHEIFGKYFQTIADPEDRLLPNETGSERHARFFAYHRQRLPGRRAMGYKLLQYQAQGRYEDLWDRLKEDDVHKIFLKREVMGRLASYLRGNKTGLWKNDAENTGAYPAGLKVDATWKDVCKFMLQDAELDEYQHSCKNAIEVWYEDLVDDPQKEGTRVTSFLGLPKKQLSARTTLQRATSENYGDAFANFDVLLKDCRELAKRLPLLDYHC